MEDDGVEDGEDGGGRAESEGQREDGDDAEAGRPTQGADGLPGLTRHRVDDVGATLAARQTAIHRDSLAPPPRQVAEALPNFGFRLLPRAPLRHRLVDAAGEVEVELVVRLGVHLGAAAGEAEGAAGAGRDIPIVGAHGAPSAVRMRCTASV